MRIDRIEPVPLRLRDGLAGVEHSNAGEVRSRRGFPYPGCRSPRGCGEERLMLRPLRAAVCEIRDIARAATTTHRRLRDRFVVVVIVTLGVDVVCGFLAFLAERDTSQSDIKSVGSAMFWSTTQLLTVSSSFKNPTSIAGRILDILMEGYAIIVVATLAGSLGAFFQKRGEELAARHPAKH